MKSRVMQISLMVMLAIFAQVWVVSAQVQNGNEQGLVGSWNLTVTLRDCDKGTPFFSFPGMITYNQGGTTQQTAVPGPDGPALPGHGAWSHQTGRNYSGAFQFFGLNPAGTYAARVIVRSTIRLGKSGDSYTSTDTAEIFNTNGDLLFRSCSTSTATRFE
ncbi:MAG: hypothetical protein ABJB34_11585 [Acidobacteriota bacterium]